MATVIICIILVLICIYAIWSYKKRLSSGCCGGGGEIKIKPKDGNPNHYPHKVTVYIDGMTCEHCKNRVENAFNDTDGCLAKVNLERKCAELWTMNQISEQDIRAIVEKAGYAYVRTVHEK